MALNAGRATLGEADPVNITDMDVSVLGGTPAVTFGTSYVAGSAGSFVRTDDQLKYPPALQNDTNTVNLYLFQDQAAIDSRITDSPTFPSLTGGRLWLDLACVGIYVANGHGAVRLVVSGGPTDKPALLASSWGGGNPSDA